jgi:hypothetical protein
MSQGRLILALKVFGITATLGLLLHARPVSAFDIADVQPAALDQPRVNALLRRAPTGDPLSGVDIIFGDTIFNIQAFYDTGASGVVLSDATADFLGVQRAQFAGTPVVFEDVGVGGSATFNVSEPLYIALAPFSPSVDINNLDTASLVYDQSFGPLRAQVGGIIHPLLPGLDIFGMPAMQGKVVVMDPKPLDTFLDLMRTYVYDPGTPFDPAQSTTNPGIPATNRHVALSYASFDRFTQTTPAGAEGPALRHNPFIGPNPVAGLDPGAPPDTTSGVTIAMGANQATGSFLLDTGAAASFISTDLAAAVNVRYRAGTRGTADPQLESFDPANPGAPGTLLPNQFQLTISGIGGDQRAAGFFLDALSVPTVEGDPLNFIGAPMLIVDISVQDPLTLDTLTLDGVFGMNFLVASAFVIEDPFSIGPFSTGPFEWVVFDEPNGVLGLQVAALPIVPMITDPAVGATLAGASVSFTWTANGNPVEQYRLTVGSSLGANDLFDSQPLPNTQLSVTATLPTDGRPLFVRFFYMIAGVWASTDVSYTAADIGPIPDIKANDSDGPVTITAGSSLSITVALAADDHTTQADWWVAAQTPLGWFYLDLTGGGWKPSLAVTLQAPLFDLAPVTVLSTSDLPLGAYVFYFAVDLTMNGSIDQPLFVDGVAVNIQ